MAGIGFVLRRLTRQDDLIGLVQGYGHSALASTGPWLFTILSLATIGMIGGSLEWTDEISVFRVIVIYNFAFSLVLSGPVVLTITRFLSDAVYRRDMTPAPGALLGGLIIVYATQAPLVAWFYGWHVGDLTPTERVFAVANYLLIAGIWVVALFLTVLKDFRFITRTFFVGTVIQIVAAAFLGEHYGTPGLLAGFSFGCAAIMFALIGRVLGDYPYPIRHPFRFLGAARTYWELPVSGFIYNLAVWSDKWLMWFSPDAEMVLPGMPSARDYDGAMFLAFLTIVPAMAVFMVAIETGFHECYLRYSREIDAHAALPQIRRNHAALLQQVWSSFRNLLVVQAIVCLTTILVAPQIYAALNTSFMQMGIFRFGVLGALFHFLFMFLCVILEYFDFRREILAIYGVFLVANAGLTLLCQEMGFAYLGAGYAGAAMITFCVAFIVADRAIRDLPYHTFIGHNASVR